MKTVMRRAVSVALLVLVGMLVSQGTVTERVSAVGVENVPPSFIDLRVEKTNESIWVHLWLSDYNNWITIYYVNITISDEQNNTLSKVEYRQHDKTDNLAVKDTFTNIEGNSLDLSRTYGKKPNPERGISRYPAFYYENCTMIISFAYSPIPHAAKMHLIAYDVNMTYCELYSSFPGVALPPLVQNAVIPLFISALVAAIVTTFVVWTRYKSNKMAQAVETITVKDRARAEAAKKKARGKGVGG